MRWKSKQRRDVQSETMMAGDAEMKDGEEKEMKTDEKESKSAYRFPGFLFLCFHNFVLSARAG